MQPKIGDWEIDKRLLKMGEKIACGSCGDLWVCGIILPDPYIYYAKFSLYCVIYFKTLAGIVGVTWVGMSL